MDPGWNRSTLIHLDGFQLFALLPLFREIPFFVYTNRINLLHLEWNLDRLVIAAKGFLNLLNLLMLIRQKSLSFSRNLALAICGELLIMFSTKVSLLYHNYLTDLRCCLLLLIKENYLLKCFLRTRTLMTHVSLYLLFCLELIWNCIIFNLTPKLVKNVITNLDLSETSGPNCIPVMVLKNC